MDDFLIRYAHETTALLGNTLTLRAVQVLLEEGMTVGGKTSREHLEVINVRRTWQTLEAMVRDPAPLTETALGELHRLLMQGILGDEARSYRRVPVYVRGSLHVPPKWIKVPDLMHQFVDRFHARPPLSIRSVGRRLPTSSWRAFTRLSTATADSPDWSLTGC